MLAELAAGIVHEKGIFFLPENLFHFHPVAYQYLKLFSLRVCHGIDGSINFRYGSTGVL